MISIFEHPLYLLASLAVIPAGFFYFSRFRTIERALLPMMFPGKERTDFFLSRMIMLRFAFFSLSWIFLCIASASPRWGTEFVATRQEGSSVVCVMDISRSMSVSDIAPNRLSFASQYAYLLVERMPATPVAVVLVKGSAVLSVPLTSDHRAVFDLLSTLSPAMLSSRGSGIGSGVRTALSVFPKNSTAARSIVLFTDGDETSSSLEDAAREVRADGATLIIVGIGTSLGSEMNVFPNHDEERMQKMVLREDILKKAAHTAGYQSFYISGSDAGSALRVLKAVASPEPDSRKLVYSQKPVYRYFEFLCASLFCICAAFITGGSIWRKK